MLIIITKISLFQNFFSSFKKKMKRKNEQTNKPFAQQLGNVGLIYDDASVFALRRRRLADGTSAADSTSAVRFRDDSPDVAGTVDVSGKFTTKCTTNKKNNFKF